jgi:glutamyl-tRNA synthetase
MENNNTKKVVTRFAPSPTGFMHIGGVRTALYAWAYARKNNGKFILRIEDTDKAREVEGSIPHIIKSLKWLGIYWDEGVDIGGPNGPYLQSERLESYRKYAKILVDKGLAYADPYTEEEIESFKKQAEESKKPFLYRNHRPENPPVWDGTKPLRLKITDIKQTKWHDEVRGDLSAGPEALDDFILMKSDGYPTYNLAHIIDDLEMGVTHIMRADEFISSTPKFLALYEALGIERPLFATLPPILAPDGKKKLGKRDGAKDILDYKEEGYLPQAILNFLVYIGWNPGGEKEIITPEEFIELFDISKIHHSGARFNQEKLDWINKEHIKLLTKEEQENYVDAYIPDGLKKLPNYTKSMLEKITPLVLERISKGSDIKIMAESGELTFLFGKPGNIDKELLIWKSIKENGDKFTITKNILEEVVSEIETKLGEDDNSNKIKDVLWPLSEKFGRGEVLWPLRVSLSGLEKSPDPFTIISIIGKEETVSRLKSIIQILSIS